MRLTIIWLPVVALVAACGNGPTSPSVISSSGDGSARVSALGAPPLPQIGPGAGTGTVPTLGAPNSCPTDKPRLAINVNNGKVDLFVVEAIAGLTKAYGYEAKEADKPNVLWRTSVPIDDRGGRYAQPPTLPVGKYLARVRAERRGCGGTHPNWIGCLCGRNSTTRARG